MDNKELAKILEEHLKWLKNEDGYRANLRGASLPRANLCDVDLRDSRLRGVNLCGARLCRADLRRVDLRDSRLRGADLRRADLRGARLCRANLCDVDLRDSRLRGADLRDSRLCRADLRDVDLRDSRLRGANLCDANLCHANLSNTKEFILSKKYLSQFKKNGKGIIVYKGIGNTVFQVPTYWEIKAKKYLEEIVNPDRGTMCGCGVNFGTLDWIKKEYPNSEIWECVIHFEDLADVIVPFGTDGKARCARLQLIKKIDRQEVRAC